LNSPMISLRDVTVDNWKACIELQLKEDQKHLIAPNVHSIAWSKVEPNLLPLAIHANDTLVGFTLVDSRPYSDDGCHWILRFMIAADYQGRGYGCAGMGKVIEFITFMKDVRAIRISFVPDNEAARRLYLKLGFLETGEIDNGEIVLEMKL